MSVWVWEKVNPGRQVVSGELGKQFKNEVVKQPGALQGGAPPPDATVLAREALQNSWDAGQALQRSLEEQGIDPPLFRAVFSYRALTGDAKARLIDSLGLDELHLRAAATSRRQLGLGDEDCLERLGDLDDPLRLLVLEEHGTTGMDGPWKNAKSKLYLALATAGITRKGDGSGGSYGYGKAGLIRGSAPRVLLAHTCFRPRVDDPGVTRRLLGMTYWGEHEVGDDAYTGFARLGHHEADDTVTPLENEEADRLAGELGLFVRDGNNFDDLGSSFLLLDPTIAPDHLCKAIERNWWPAILDNLIDVTIETDEGDVLHPRPRRDEVLQTFIRGYELATTPQDNSVPSESRRKLGTYSPQGSGNTYELGYLGMHADLTSWSYAQGTEHDEDGTVDHQSLIALVRGPRMVVEYYKAVRGQPYVRGTFVADPSIDELLRQTEPKAHDAWETRGDEGIETDAPKVAKETLKRVRDAVRDFKKQLKPPAPKEQDLRLPLLDELLKNVLENRGTVNPPPPPPDPRPIGIHIAQKVEAAGTGIRLAAHVTVRLTDHHPKNADQARVEFRYVFDEDGSRGDNCPLDFTTLPKDFALVSKDDGGTVVTGPLTHTPVDFHLTSEPYDPDWSTQFIVTATLADQLATGDGPVSDE